MTADAKCARPGCTWPKDVLGHTSPWKFNSHKWPIWTYLADVYYCWVTGYHAFVPPASTDEGR